MGKQKCLAFDVDNTLKLGPYPGPVDPEDLRYLMNSGHIVGLCGNYKIAMKFWPQWYQVISFFGGHPPLLPYKPQFLAEVKASIIWSNPQVVDYIMVGNSKASAQAGLALPTANDDGYARLAGWQFWEAQNFNKLDLKGGIGRSKPRENPEV